MNDYQLAPTWPPGQEDCVIRRSDSQVLCPDGPGWPEYRQWLDGNTPDPAPPPSLVQLYAERIASGLAVTSEGTPSLNGTYSISESRQQTISAIYAGIKGGDGLPGGGATFAYPDISGVPHLFMAEQFAAFAKATRDYLYALALAAQRPNPAWPAAVASIP